MTTLFFRLAASLVGVLGGFAMLTLPAHAQEGELSRCGTSQMVESPRDIELAFTLEQVGDDTAPGELTFGTNRSDDVLVWDVNLVSGVSDPGTPVVMDVKIPGIRPRSTSVSGIISNNGRRLDIRLCVDPSQPDRISPGEYRGVVQVDDSRFGDYKREIVVRLQHEPVYTPLAAVSIGAMAGALWQWGTSWNGLSEAEKGRRRQQSAIRHLSLAKAELATAAVLGLILAFVTVFMVSYIQNPSWEGSLSAHIKLVVAGFAAATGAYGLVGLLHGFLRRSGGSSTTIDQSASPPLATSSASTAATPRVAAQANAVASAGGATR